MAKGEQNGADTAQLVARISELEQALEQKSREHGDLQAEHAALSDEHEKLKAEHGNAVRALAEASDKRSEAVLKIADLEDQVNFLEGKVEELKAKPEGGREQTLAPTEDQAPADKKARGEEIPAWQTPDYNGPMTGEIAIWRNQHLKTK